MSKTEIFIQNAVLVHGNNKFDYSNTVYTKAKEKVEVKCLECGNTFSTFAFNHIGAKTGCRDCNKKRNHAHRKRKKFVITITRMPVSIVFD